MTILSTLLGSRQWSDMPCGAFLPYGGTSAPTGFLMCDGSAVSRNTYSDLFAVFGTVFGVGDGSTTFNVPDLRGRGVIGAGTGTGGGASGTGAPTGGSALTARANGAWLGAETHALTEAELASHRHSIAFAPSNYVTGGPLAVYAWQATTSYTGYTGSGDAHNNVQPVVASNWIVKCVRAFSGSQSFLSRGFIDGLTTSNAADTEHDITIAVGACRDSSDAYNMTLASALTKRIDASWAAGDAGGLFSGSVANSTWYHVFLIRKDSDGTIDAGFDTSVVAANKPAGYSTYRRIGSVLTNGSANIIAFTQNGDQFTWVASTTDITGTAASSTTLATISIPLGIIVKVRLCFHVFHATTVGAWLYVDDAAAEGQNRVGCSTNVAGRWNSITHEALSNTSSQIRYQADAAGQTCSFRTLGWIDLRGKDA